MSGKYPLRISQEVKKVFELYLQVDPLKRYNTVSQFLNSILNEKANELLEFFKSEMENNSNFKNLIKKDYKEVLKAIELDLKF